MKHQPNVMFLTIDTLRADHLGCYGYFRDTTPAIDQLAADGVVFKDSYASAIATGPSYTCMITGKVAAHHKYYITPFRTPNAQQLDDRIPTMAEVLLQNGYTTAAFDNLMSWRAHPKHFARGYNFYVNVGEQPIGHSERISSDKLTRRMIEWLRSYAREESPFFLFAHYWLPHTPYSQPMPYRTLFKHEPGDLSDLKVKTAGAGYQYVQGWGAVDRMVDGETKFFRPYYDEIEEIVSIDLYDGATRYVDHQIGQVLGALKDLGLYEHALIILTSDHGEGLGQHNVWGHGTLYDHTVHVPIIMKHPDLPQGKAVDGYVQHVDLFPTIQEVTGATRWPDFTYYSDDGDDPTLDGQSVFSLAAGGSPVRDRIYLEAGNQLRAVRTREWKLITDLESQDAVQATELYNILRDPMEIQDLSAAQPRIAAQMRDDLATWLESYLGDEANPLQNVSVPPSLEAVQPEDGFQR
jgi:arylsulfatase A-like enzyme